MANELYRALVNEVAEDRSYSLDDLVALPEDGLGDRLPTGDRALRGQTRLLIKSMVDIARTERRNHEYAVLLRAVPWCNSRAKARRATDRLLAIAEWASEADGEEAGSCWSSAAEVASWLTEDYNGYPHRASYADLAGWYVDALRCVGWDERLFRELLAALEPKADE
ncbi:hypothetical protein ACH4S8_37900 [Streptomyces sp. NPDC021080]|uniref:hypothetical protein n=1 Tax=Streptomyces sp. NPDC021080 TaxID=3365110 RepID=UPI003795DEAC